ncbi:MAG: thioredoxin family protein [Gemmataceae bacterium]|nr:thioredoxin family protein [Gemmataceae bacterium]
MKFLLLAIATLVWASYVQAAEGVQWRSDYSKAVQEAAATKRPMLLDFGTVACVYCRKLDATTFRDPGVIRLLNERFVPIKIDGDRDLKLVQAMRIESYPTLVVAGPDGSVLSTNPGYLDASGMMRFLQGGLVKVPKSLNRVAPSGREKDGPSVLLEQAKRDLKDGFYLCCVERCDRLIRLHPTSAESDKARQIAQQAASAGGDKSREVLAILRRSR